ncbi:conserved protein of unknown function [Candidatus Hydrogenisulfobacillus filiaventi]|uniref:Glutamine--fructose-6-phosphate aminotransferase [isomerizing] n=1 Tax=Candidatus Hydrogenisulfobacillus filiaventi TaxID=2707344 RepID=A0A6F8ZDL8_9FIRM|nr:conserved protein of unknown function [Candidatus Hydrogenisulfobacillus filiaventi]
MGFMEEMREQPTALSRLLDYYAGAEGRSRLQAARRLLATGPVVLLGMGPSYIAAVYAAYRLNQRGVPAVALEASLALADHAALLKAAPTWILLSQSGETPEVLDLAQAEGHQLLGITNDEASSLGRSGMPLLPLKAAPEEGTSSKTYINTLAVLALLGGDPVGFLRPLPDLLQRLVDQPFDDPGPVPPEVTFVARGPSLASALEGALLLRQAAHVTASGFSGAGFRHGAWEWARDRSLVVFLGRGVHRELQSRLAVELTARGNRLLTIGLGEGDVALPPLPASLAPLAEIVPVQHLAVAWAAAQGLEPGRLPGKVTRE